MHAESSGDLSPFQLVEQASSTSLLLTDFSAGAQAFEAQGYEAGGYAWQGLAKTLIRLQAPHLRARIKFDSESSMFTAYGTDRAALVELAQLLREVMRNDAVLMAALQQTDADEMD